MTSGEQLPGTLDTARPRHHRRLGVTIGLTLVGLAGWLAAVAALGSLSLQPNPALGDTVQQFFFGLLLTVPVVLWFGTRRRQHSTNRQRTTEETVVTRRRVLSDGALLVGVGAAGTVVGRSGLAAASGPQTPTQLIASDHGPIDGPRVLVAYESQYGSTGEVADTIARMLAERGDHVEVRHMASVDGIGGYERIVVGGAIQYDRWMPGAASFVRHNRERLAEIPVAFFFTCLALSQPGVDATRSAASYEDKIRAIAPEIGPISVGRFAGVLDYSRMTPVARIFARFLLTLRGADPGDHRNWSEIDAWVRSLDQADQLLPDSSEGPGPEHPIAIPEAAGT